MPLVASPFVRVMAFIRAAKKSASLSTVYSQPSTAIKTLCRRVEVTFSQVRRNKSRGSLENFDSGAES